jgi:regulator of replication initiation timing
MAKVEGTAKQVMDQILVAKANYQKAETAFFEFLIDVEAQRKDVWEGFESFDMFLNTHHVVNPARYREYVAGRGIAESLTSIDDLGVDGVRAIRQIRTPSKEKLDEIVRRSRDFEEVNRVKPSEQTVGQWVRELNRGEPQVVLRASEIRRLRLENEELKKKIRVLEGQLAATKKELEKARGKRKATAARPS